MRNRAIATCSPDAQPTRRRWHRPTAIAGLKQVIAERQAADVGTTGLGRVILSQPTPTSVQVGEDFAANPAATPAVPASPFGLKLSAISTTIAGATVTQPTATPPAMTPPSPLAMSVDLAAATPQVGDTVKFTFKLPDGTSEDINLTASSATPLPANSFAIGATPAATAANLNTALTTATQALANGPLVAASAIQAGNDFFGQPPLRVAGTAPFGAATGQVAGTSANTVIWYQGETGTDPARGTAVAQIDQGISVQYGARANEQALRTELQNVAVFAAVTTSATNPNAIIPGTQTIQDIQADFAGAQASIKAATDRQTQSKSMAQTMLDSIEGVNNDEVATKILALQTALQASYTTTSDLYKMSLVKFM
jgi:flagellar hook-associated protein 3 FlgL